MRRSIVISGIGTVSTFGVSAQTLWQGLQEGRSGIGPSTRVDLSGYDCQLTAEIHMPPGPDGASREFTARDYVPKAYRKATKVMARDIEIAVACAQTAADDAGLVTRAAEGAQTTYPPERIGCQIGAGLIAAETAELAGALATAIANPPTEESKKRGGFDYRAWGTVATPNQTTGGMENLPPLWMLKYLPNMLACHVTIIHGTEGPSNTLTCCEASGLLSIGEGSRIIERGAADLCFSGSAESKLNLMGLMRLSAAQRLARVKSNQSPNDACRPYDPVSTGSIPGEGGGIVMLEDEAMARARGIKPYAMLAGFGAAHSMTNLLPPFNTPGPDSINQGLAGAIKGALKDAGITPDQIDAIVPQASACPFFDLPEAGAFRAIFGPRLATIDIVPLVPTLGDCFAGNGGLQTAVAALCLRHQALPRQTIRLGKDPANPSCAPAPGGRKNEGLKHILVCSSSVGGQNAALVLRSCDANLS